MIDKIHDMVMSYRRLKMREIVTAVSILNDRVYNILYQHL